MDNVEYNRFCWRLSDRSMYHYFVKTSDLHQEPRRRDDWSSLEELLDPRKECGRQSFVVSTQESQEHQEIETLHRLLCPRCAGIDFASMDPSDWRSSVCLGSFSEIVMDAACPTCKLFSCLVAKYAETVSDDWKFYLCPFPTSALYGVHWTWEPDVPGVEKTLSFSILDQKTFVDESRVCQPEFIRAVGVYITTRTTSSHRGKHREIWCSVTRTVRRFWRHQVVAELLRIPPPWGLPPIQ